MKPSPIKIDEFVPKKYIADFFFMSRLPVWDDLGIANAIAVQFLAVQNSSIGDLVGWSVRHHYQSESSQHYRVNLKTCDH